MGLDENNLNANDSFKQSEDNSCNTNSSNNSQYYARSTHSNVAMFSYVIAIIVYAIGFIVGLFAGMTDNRSNYDTAFLNKISSYFMIAIWAGSFVLGSVFVVAGKIVDLLNDIKLKR